MPRLLTGNHNDSLLAGVEVAGTTLMVDYLMKGQKLETKAITVGVVFGLYDYMLRRNLATDAPNATGI